MKNITIRSMMCAIVPLCSVLGGCTDDPPCAGDPPIGPILGEIASGQDGPGRVVLDHDHVYWVNHGTGTNGSVMRLAKADGELQVLAEGQTLPLGLVVDDLAVYWTNAGVNGDGQVMRVAKTGGTPVALATGISSPGELAGDDTHLYWSNQFSGVERVAKLGGQHEQLVSTEEVSTGIAIDDKSVYFGDMISGEIRSVTKTGGVVTIIASVPQTEIPFLVVDDANVYWHSGGVDSLMQVKATGGTPSVLFPADYEMRYFVVTPDTVFVAQLRQPPGTPPGPGAIHEFDRATRTDKAITKPSSGNWGVAIDDRAVYWTNHADGTVNAVAR